MDLEATFVYAHVGEFQGFTPWCSAAEWMSVQWVYGVEARTAQIEGVCRQTRGGWVAVTKGPT